jgi:hypothetical protein
MPCAQVSLNAVPATVNLPVPFLFYVQVETFPFYFRSFSVTCEGTITVADREVRVEETDTLVLVNEIVYFRVPDEPVPPGTAPAADTVSRWGDVRITEPGDWTILPHGLVRVGDGPRDERTFPPVTIHVTGDAEFRIRRAIDVFLAGIP